VVGGGGREHALSWRLAREPDVTAVLCSPGNPGIAQVAQVVPSDGRGEALLDLAAREQIDLTVIGPELPLCEGVVDAFRNQGRAVVGPSRDAANLECSKGYAKTFMARHGIPTARHRLADNPDEAGRIVRSAELGFPVVVKADGLAAGKGVVVAADGREALAAVESMMRDRRFGDAGAKVVIEECLQGPELSFFVLCDGSRAVPIGSAQDHKRAFDGDAGPNTGGMGAFSPSPLCDRAIQDRIMREVVEPVMQGMREEGHPYTGFLYCGLMLTAAGPRVIEFNVRFGDPEAQVVLPLIEGEFAGALLAAARGDLQDASLTLSNDRTVGVVLASKGYPDSYEIGRTISGLDADVSDRDALVFHAGTASRDGAVVTSGGRVLTVVGRGDCYDVARRRAYEAASRISFDGLHLRRDIGEKALAFEKAGAVAKD
jgi:phosphoribosylamine---glycine ligase